MSKINDLIKKLCPNGVKFKKIIDIAEVGTGSSNRQDAVEDGVYPFYVRSKEVFRINKFEYDEEAIIIPGEGGIGEIFHYVNGKYALHQRAYRIHIVDNRMKTKFLYYYMFNSFKDFIMLKAVNATVTSIRKPMIEQFSVPIPPIEVQEEIIRILDKFGKLEEKLEAELEAELKTRKSQYKFWRDKLLNEEYETKYLPELSINLDNKRKPVSKSDRVSGSFPYYGASGIVDYVSNYIFDDELLLISEDGANLKARSTPIAFSLSGKTWVNNHAHVLKFDSRITQKYVEHYLNMIDLSEYITGAAQPKLNQENLNKIRINIPSSIKEQEKIVTVLERFDKLINDISNRLSAEMELRKKQYEYYRNKLLSFKEL